MRVILVAATVTLSAALPLSQAQAWMHANAGGGYTHYGTAGGFDHATSVGPQGVAHAGNAGGYAHGTAANSQGVAHASNAGGYYHSTGVNSSGAVHTNAYNTTTVNGAYYHQPAVVNNYGAGCYNCGAPGWGAVAAGTAVGVAAGVAIGAAAVAPVYAPPAAYAALPVGCVYRPVFRRYECGAAWLAPAYGANGVYYQVVPPP